jgi:hypothetical protein
VSYSIDKTNHSANIIQKTCKKYLARKNSNKLKQRAVFTGQYKTNFNLLRAKIEKGSDDFSISSIYLDKHKATEQNIVVFLKSIKHLKYIIDNYFPDFIKTDDYTFLSDILRSPSDYVYEYRLAKLAFIRLEDALETKIKDEEPCYKNTNFCLKDPLDSEPKLKTLNKVFKKLPILSKEIDPIPVEFLDEFGIDYTVYKLEHPSKKISTYSEEKSKDKFMFFSWEIILKPLKKEQFIYLKEKFRSKIDESSFDPTKNYHVSDFLPKPWQDLMGCSYEVKEPYLDTSIHGNWIYNSTNCFATAIASLNTIFNSDKNFPKFCLDSDLFLDLVKRMIHSVNMRDFETINTDRAKAETYDLGILKFDKWSIKHAYIYLDDTWIFERVGNDGSLPYRLAPKQAVDSCYSKGLERHYCEDIIKINPKKVALMINYLYTNVKDGVLRIPNNNFINEFLIDIYDN